MHQLPRCCEISSNAETDLNSCDYDIQLSDSELSPDQCHDKVKSVSTGNFPCKWTGLMCGKKSWGLEVFRYIVISWTFSSLGCAIHNH